MGRIHYYAGLGVLVAALAVGTIGCANTSKKEKKVVIPGTWTYDIDSMRLSGDEKQFTDSVKHFGMKIGFPLEILVYGANDDDCDLFWMIGRGDVRRLIPRNGAEFTYFGKADFDNVTLEDLADARYTNTPLSGDIDDNQLTPGTVIGIRTKEGRLAKLKVTGYLDLSFENGDPSIPSYDFTGLIMVYDKP